MKKIASKQMRKVCVPVFVLLSLLFLVSGSSAKEKSNGALIQIHKIDGRMIEGELLAVKDTRLILMDSGNLSGITEDLRDIRTIQIMKKSKLLPGLLIVGGSEALLGLLGSYYQEGFLGLSAGQRPLLYGAVLAMLGGGIGGALKKIDETISLEGRTPDDIKHILNKLSLIARFPVELPDNLKAGYLKNQNNDQEAAPKPVAAPRQFTIDDSLNHKKASSIFARFHISLLPGYFSSQGIAGYEKSIKAWGFGVTKQARTECFWGVTLKFPAVNYPLEVRNPVIELTGFRMEYSISKKIALGFEFFPLGNHEVHGYRRIDLLVNAWNAQYLLTYSDLFLLAKYRGAAYYFTAAWMPLPLPDGYLKKSALKVGGGIGLDSTCLSFETSDSEYTSEYTKEIGEKRDFSKISLGLKAFCEYDYYFSKTWSLGIHVSYEYLPIKVSPFQLRGYYFDLDATKNLIHNSVVIDFPEQKMNFGGFGAGLSFGFHF